MYMLCGKMIGCWPLLLVDSWDHDDWHHICRTGAVGQLKTISNYYSWTLAGLWSGSNVQSAWSWHVRDSSHTDVTLTIIWLVPEGSSPTNMHFKTHYLTSDACQQTDKTLIMFYRRWYQLLTQIPICYCFMCGLVWL